MLVGLLVLFVVAQVGVCVHLGGAVVGARLLGIGVARVSLGTGPAAVSRAVGGVGVQIGALPFGGFVEPDPLPAPGRSAAWMLTGPLALLLAAVALVQVDALDTFVQTSPQLVRGAVSPVGHGAVVLERVLAAPATLPPVVLVGRVWATLAAFNVLVAVPQALLALLPERLRLGATMLWLLVLLAALGAWTVALIAAVWP
jgi:membrane-associated protease RseP (regulator of RpoE activity)